MNDALPYRNPLVRDLAWALSSPPLLQRVDADIRWLDQDWLSEVTACYQSLLQTLEHDPQPLRDTVNAQKDRRLGNYFETLWRFWLATNDRYALLYANLPLRSATRTIGEFDFLVKDRETGKVLHWEVAVKFYLGVADTLQPANWWGPARRDRLDIKTRHLLEHQGRLSRHHQAVQLFEELGIHVDETWLLLKGRLFYPADRQAVAPQGAHPAHLRGFWLQRSAFPAGNDTSWVLLDRHQWLAPLAGVDSSACVDSSQLLETWVNNAMTRPVCVARIEAGRELERGFIVPDNWPAESG